LRTKTERFCLATIGLMLLRIQPLWLLGSYTSGACIPTE